MRRVLMVAAAAALTVVGSAALAQGGPGGGGQGRRGMMGGGMMGGLALLRVPKVQQELKMTQPQIDKIDTKQQEVMQAMREAFQGAGGGGGGFQNMTPEERAKAMQKITEIQQKAVADILDTTQQKRFAQIELQAGGPAVVLRRKDLSDKLAVTDEQKTKMQEIQQAQNQARRDLMPQGGFQAMQNMTPEERKAYQDKVTALNKETNTKLLAVFTPAQQKQWKEMCGVPFEMPANAFGMGGGRRGGGGPGGGGPGGGGNPPL